MKRTIKHEADGKRMTLGELRRFLAAVEGVSDDAVIKVRVPLGGGVRSIEVVEDDPSSSDGAGHG